jgi:hypothetical protein
MICRCVSIDSLEGEEAEKYSREHLVKVRTDANTWETFYVCPETGKRWIKDYPRSELHGGGPPRLRALATDEQETEDSSDE